MYARIGRDTRDTGIPWVVIGMETAAARALLQPDVDVDVDPHALRFWSTHAVFVRVRSCGISVHSNFANVCTYSPVESRAEIGLLELSTFRSSVKNPMNGAGSGDASHDSST